MIKHCIEMLCLSYWLSYLVSWLVILFICAPLCYANEAVLCGTRDIRLIEEGVVGGQSAAMHSRPRTILADPLGLGRLHRHTPSLLG